MPNKEDVSAIILAAGKGERTGQGGKAFLNISGQSYLNRSIEVLLPFCGELIVTLREEDRPLVPDRLKRSGIKFVVGGETRQDSVQRAMEQVTSKMVLVHDVARPLITAGLVEKVLMASDRDAEVCPVVRKSGKRHRNHPLYLESDDLAFEGKEIDEVFLQTPQAFRSQHLLRALNMAKENSWQENSLIPILLMAGYCVRAIEGDEENIKVTYPEDVALVEEKYR